MILQVRLASVQQVVLRHNWTKRNLSCSFFPLLLSSRSVLQKSLFSKCAISFPKSFSFPKSSASSPGFAGQLVSKLRCEGGKVHSSAEFIDPRSRVTIPLPWLHISGAPSCSTRCVHSQRELQPHLSVSEHKVQTQTYTQSDCVCVCVCVRACVRAVSNKLMHRKSTVSCVRSRQRFFCRPNLLFPCQPSGP